MNLFDFEEKLKFVLKNDLFAFRMCQQLIYISHLWDDLIDKDKVRTDEEVNDAWRMALAEVPMNPFFHAHIHLLGPLIQNAVLQYEVANRIEKGQEQRKEVAFWLRNGLLMVILTCMDILGGPVWVRQVGADFFSFAWEDYQHLFGVFQKEMTNG